MRHLVIPGALVAGLLVVLFVALILRQAAQRRAASRIPARPEPPSVVHLLADDAELRAAVERASRFERNVAELLETRATRYESLLAGSQAPELRAVPEPDGTHDTRRTMPA